MRKNLKVTFHVVGVLILTLITDRLSAQPQNAVIFRDDFNRTILGGSWVAASSWSIVNGSAYNSTEGIGGTLRTEKTYLQPSYIIETKAGGFTVNYKREFRITFGQPSLSEQSMYVVAYKPYDGGTFSLSRSTNNIYFPETLDEVVLYPNLNSLDWYNFKIARYKSGLIQVFLDKGAGYGEIPLLEAVDSTFKDAGHIGWQVDTESFSEGFYVDWITAYEPAVEKPALREKPGQDKLITQISSKSQHAYSVTKLVPGIKQYTDRDYNITSVPSYLNGASFIQTAMSDKWNASDSFLTFFIKKAAIVYIGYDPRGKIIPSWLSSWTKTGDHIGTSDPGSNYLELYSKVVQGGELYPNPTLLGGNSAAPALGSEVNYLVAAIEIPSLMPLQAEDASLSGPVVSNDHPGYNGGGFADYKNPLNDYVEWTVRIDVPGSYTLGFRYANAGSADRSLLIENDGNEAGIVSFSSTESWSNWSFVSGPTVYFTPGIHKIRSTATGLSGPNLDELSVFYTSLTAPVVHAKPIESLKYPTYLPAASPRAYPNPFTRSTTIYYNLQEKAKVVLSVYSLHGQQVGLLANEIQEKGNHHASFDGENLPAGVYLYKLQVGNRLEFGRMLKQ